VGARLIDAAGGPVTGEKMRIVATVEARMTSSRLPGKVLLPVKGRPLLEYVVRRVKRVPSVQEIVLATTVNGADDPLCELAEGCGIKCFRGSEEDVMMRIIGAAESVNADIVVEITGDCPVIDPLVIEHAIQMFLRNACDYVCNVGIAENNVNVYSYPNGMDTQVYELATLKRSAEMTTDPADREHVTLHIRNHPELFRAVTLVAPPDLYWPELRLTLDTRKDYEMLKFLIEHFGEQNPCFGCREIIELLKKHPEKVVLGEEQA